MHLTLRRAWLIARTWAPGRPVQKDRPYDVYRLIAIPVSVASCGWCRSSTISIAVRPPALGQRKAHRRDRSEPAVPRPWSGDGLSLLRV